MTPPTCDALADARPGRWRGGRYGRRPAAASRRLAVTLCAGLTAACAGTSDPAAELPAAPALPPVASAPAGGVAFAALLAPDDEELVRTRAILETRAPRLDALDCEAVARLLVATERRHGLPSLLLLALIEQESRFDPRARGPRGSLGLMQVRPFVGRDVAHRAGWPFEEDMLLDPVENVRIGTRYLAELHARFGSTELALAAYNAGPTRIRRRQHRGQSTRTRYVHRVLARYEAFQAAAADGETLAGG